jgi:hypothetical protein
MLKAFADQIVVKEGEGYSRIVKHPEMDRFRVIIPLSAPYVLKQHGKTSDEANEKWGAFYRGVAKLLGVSHDKSCEDISRLMYLPEHPHGAANYFAYVVGGHALTFEEIKPVEKPKPNRKEHTGKGTGGTEKPKYQTRRLGQFHARSNGVYDIIGLMQDAHGQENYTGRSAGGIVGECPLANEHTDSHISENRGGFWSDGDGETEAIARCSHSCHKAITNTLIFVDAACQKLGIGDASELAKYVPEIVGRPLFKMDDVIEPYADDAEAIEQCERDRPTKRKEDKRSVEDRQASARRLGASVLRKETVARCTEALLGGDFTRALFKVSSDIGTASRNEREQQVKREETAAEAGRSREQIGKFTVVKELHAIIDKFTRNTPDTEIEALMVKMHASDAIEDSAKRMAVRRIGHRIHLHPNDRDVRYVKDMWASVTWRSDHSRPTELVEVSPGVKGLQPSKDRRVVFPYMSARYAPVRWGKDYVFVDMSLSAITPYSKGSLLEEYHDTRLEIPDPDGELRTVPNWFAAWRENISSHRYDRVVFKPRGYVAPNELNLYRGDTLKAVEGDWSKLRRHMLDNVCQGNVYLFAYMICTLAAWVQRPDVKYGVCVVLQGLKGTGKSKVAEWVTELYPSNSATVSDAETLFSGFNTHVAYAIVVNIPEAFWAGDKRHEGQFKAMITDPKQILQPKGVDRVEIDDFRHFIMTANANWVVPATKDERRFFVLTVGNNQAKNAAYFAAIDDQMEDGGLEGMKYDLLHLDIPSWIDLRNPPVTHSLVEQIGEGAPSEHKWFRHCLMQGRIVGPRKSDGSRDTVVKWYDTAEEGDCEQKRAEEQDSTLGPLQAQKQEVLDAYLDFARSLPRGRGQALDLAGLGKFLTEVCGDGVSTRPRVQGFEGTERVTAFKFPADLDSLKQRFTERTKLPCDADSGTALGLGVPAAFPPAERAWCEWGMGGKTVPSE